MYKNWVKYGLIFIISLFTTIAVMIREELQIDITQKLLMTFVFIASFLCYYKIYNKEKHISKIILVLSLVLSLFKYCQLTKDINSEFIYFFKYLKEAPIIAFIAITGYTALYYAIIVGIERLLNKIKNTKKEFKGKTEKYLNLIFEIHPVALTALIIFIFWLPHIIIQYPGAISWDTDAEIAKYLWDGEIFSSHFPVFHIWLLGSVITTCRNVLGTTNIGFFFFTMLNIGLAIAVFANTFRLMKELKTPLIFRIICLGVYGIFPMFIGHIIINVKDTLYSLAVVLLITTLIKMVINEKEFWKNKKEWILYIIAGIIIILTRNNGIHLMIITSVAILIKIIITKTQILKKIIVLLIPIIISETIIQTITVAYGVLPGEKGEMYSFLIQQTARYIYFYKDEITEEEENVLRKTLGYDEIEQRYDPIISDLVKDTFTDISPEYIKVYMAQFVKHPSIYIDSTLNMIYRLFVPDIVNTEYQKTFESTYRGVKFEEEQIEILKMPRKLLYYYYKMYEVIPVTNIMSSYGTYNCLALALMALLIKNKRKKELFAYIPIIITMVILILSPVACLRYCFPIVFSIPILLATYLKEDLSTNEGKRQK